MPFVRPRRAAALLVALTAVLVPCLAAAQGTGDAGRASPASAATSPRPALTNARPALTNARAVRIRTAPVIDGRDDDVRWQEAPPSTTSSSSPRGGRRSLVAHRGARSVRRPQPVRRRARLRSAPDSIVSLLSRRDVRTNSDQIKIIIDGYLDRRTAVELMVNPAGVKRDAAIYGDVVEDMSWDGVWDGAAGIDSLGVGGRVPRPVQPARFNAGARAFGFGIWRDIARRNERVAWPPTAPRARHSSPNSARSTASPGSSAAVASSSSLHGDQERHRGGAKRLAASAEGHRRADLKYGITANATLDATVNPDFGRWSRSGAAQPQRLRSPIRGATPLLPGRGRTLQVRRSVRRDLLTRAASAHAAIARLVARSVGHIHPRRAKLTGRLSNGIALGVVEAITRREEGVNGTTIEPQTNYFVGRLVKEMRQGRSQLGRCSAP